jgi:hypothetical protein
MERDENEKYTDLNSERVCYILRANGMDKTASAIIFDMQFGKNFMPAVVIKVDRLEIGACHKDWGHVGRQSFIMR